MLTILISTLLLLSVGSIVFYTWRWGISPMPSSSKARTTILNALPENLSGILFELGSGWGTLAFPLAKKFPHCQIIAYEISPIPYLFSKIRLFFEPQKNLQILRRNFYKEDLHNASAIVCYLYPGAMEKLKIKFEKELKPGTIVISNTFAIAGWKPERIVELEDIYSTKIYCYKV